MKKAIMLVLFVLSFSSFAMERDLVTEALSQALSTAIVENDTERIKALLTNSQIKLRLPLIVKMNDTATTPLEAAVIYKNKELIQFYLQNEGYWSKWLLENNQSFIDFSYQEDKNALVYAIINDDLETAQLLVEAGADINFGLGVINSQILAVSTLYSFSIFEYLMSLKDLSLESKNYALYEILSLFKCRRLKRTNKQIEAPNIFQAKKALPMVLQLFESGATIQGALETPLSDDLKDLSCMEREEKKLYDLLKSKALPL